MACAKGLAAGLNAGGCGGCRMPKYQAPRTPSSSPTPERMMSSLFRNGLPLADALELPVFHADDAVGVFVDARVVCDDHDRAPLVEHLGLDEGDDVAAGVAVERGR